MIDPNTEISLIVTAAEINLIMSALSKMPYEMVAQLIPKLGQQIQAAVPADAFATGPQPTANGIDRPQ
jgi:hypothetical protein